MEKPIETPPAGKEPVVIDNASPAGEEQKPIEEPKVVIPTVPLSDFHNMKDVLSRVVGDDPEKLKAIAESDPKLAERIKESFPNRFKDVNITNPVTSDNLDATVAQAVKDALEGSSNRNALKSMREQLGMTEIEFSDIEGKLDNTAKSLVKNETAKDYPNALGVALQLVDPKLASELAANVAVLEAAKRLENASGGAAVGQQAQPESEAKAMEAKFDKNLPPGFSAAAPK